MASDAYPPPAFYFTVSIDGGSSVDTSFQEVSGLKVELQTETVVEGGQNRFEHRLPTRTKYSNLVLKRGLVMKGSALATWLGASFGNIGIRKMVPKNLVVMLLDASAAPLAVWRVTGAYPVRWEHDAMKSQENQLMLETLELAYQFFDRKSS